MALLGVLAVRDCQAQPRIGSVTDPASRLRPASALEAGVIADGLCRSETLRSMVDTIQTSDLIVYVTTRRLPDRVVAGGLEFLGATTTDRIVRVVLAFPLDRIARMAMLGHELQHAIEVAAAPEIRSRQTLEAFYRLHGAPGATESAWETDTARQTESRVRKEVAARPASCGR